MKKKKNPTWREGWSALCGSYFFEKMAPHFLQILGRFFNTNSFTLGLNPHKSLAFCQLKKLCTILCSYIDNWKRPLEVASSILFCPKLGDVPIPKSFENPPPTLNCCVLFWITIFSQSASAKFLIIKNHGNLYSPKQRRSKLDEKPIEPIVKLPWYSCSTSPYLYIINCYRWLSFHGHESS
jgi:hypothetical protein